MGSAVINPIRKVAARLEGFPDTPALFERHFLSFWRQYALLLLIGLVLRCSTFGDPNLHIDDAFYLFVGRSMHEGLLPYVDIWDRKPLGLFLIYYLITGISKSVVAYQVVAWFFAGSTAMMINLIARTWANIQGGLLAGITYLLMLPVFEGWGGQTPVFYNLVTACAAWLVLRDLDKLRSGTPTWRTFAAMGLFGLAISIKQTVFFEAAFFGLYAAWLSFRPTLRACGMIFTWMVLGILPNALIGLFYLHVGHWPEFWHAMVTANIKKSNIPATQLFNNIERVILRLYPSIVLAISGIINIDKSHRWIFIIWILSEFLGLVSVPNFYGHYPLPLLVPLSASAGIILQRRDIGVFATTLVAGFSMLLYFPFDFTATQRSRQSLEAMARAIQLHDSGGGLFIADGPVYLYAMSGKRPLSPLVFPPHLYEWIERNTSPFNTDATVRKILHGKPGVVVMAITPRTNMTDNHTRLATLAYVRQSCRLVDVETYYEASQEYPVAIYGDCRR